MRRDALHDRLHDSGLIGVDRKLMLAGCGDGEIDAVADAFGSGVTLAGSDANGEISPPGAATASRPNHQAMAITDLCE